MIEIEVTPKGWQLLPFIAMPSVIAEYQQAVGGGIQGNDLEAFRKWVYAHPAPMEGAKFVLAVHDAAPIIYGRSLVALGQWCVEVARQIEAVK